MLLAYSFGNDRLSLSFEFVFGFGQAVEAAPDEAVHAYDHQGDEDGGEQDDGEAAGVGGGLDLCA